MVIDWTALWGDLRGNMAVVAAVAGLVVLLLVGWLIARLTRRRGGQGDQPRVQRRVIENAQGDQPRVQRRVIENALTLAAAGVATGVAATGMWRFFADVLGMRSVASRVALFAFLEIALFVEAIRARRNLLDDLARIDSARAAAEKALKAAKTDEERAEARAALARVGQEPASTGVDGRAVWVLAALSGTFSAADADRFSAMVFRLVAPLVAAWLWERGLAAHRRQHRARSAINWTMTPRRVLVKLGLAEPTGRGVDEVDAARRKARLARTAYRLHMLKVSRAWAWRIGRADRALRRQVEQANEHLGLATDAAVRAEIRVHLATLYQMVTGTSPESVQDLDPWSSRGGVAVPARVNGYDPAQRAEELTSAAMRLVEARMPAVAAEPAEAGPREVEGVAGEQVVVQQADRERDAGGPVLTDRLPVPHRQLVPAQARQVSPAPMGAAVPARRVTARVASLGSEAPVSVKWQAFALLDEQVAPDESRSPQDLAQLIVDRLDAQPATAKRYEREWRNQLAAGQRPQAKARRLRVVATRTGTEEG